MMLMLLYFSTFKMPGTHSQLSQTGKFACSLHAQKYLYAQGQGKVSSSQAQIYYSSTPIWSALLAMLLLEGESMGPMGWLGGAGIVVAGLIAQRK